jgi:Fe-Mn family superoxide dismutase
MQIGQPLFKLSRRDFLKATLASATALSLGVNIFARAKASYELPPLPYDYNALEPYIDEMTMSIHHGKHHQGYVNNLNKALEGHDDLAAMSVEDLLRNIEKVPEDIRQTVINNGGGHANHSLFWTVMTANSDKTPHGELTEAIHLRYSSFDDFRAQFEKAANTRFGSGWAWLVVDKYGALQVYSTANQDSPLMQGHTPILGIDVWEHAYYLKYQNRRAEYVSNFFNIINWQEVEKRYAAAKA